MYQSLKKMKVELKLLAYPSLFLLVLVTATMGGVIGFVLIFNPKIYGVAFFISLFWLVHLTLKKANEDEKILQSLLTVGLLGGAADAVLAYAPEYVTECVALVFIACILFAVIVGFDLADRRAKKF